MSARTTLWIAALLALAAPACRKETPWPPPPAEVHLGEDDCSACKMIISEERFAAQVRTRAGGVTLFDDLGCLLEKGAAAHADPEGVFVRAFDHDAGSAGKAGASAPLRGSSGWVRGDEAFVVRSRGIRSPMGYGFAAFASKGAAEIEAARHPDAAVVPLAALLRDGARPVLPDSLSVVSSAPGDPHP